MFRENMLDELSSQFVGRIRRMGRDEDCLFGEPAHYHQNRVETI
jgi:hypothetical protein